jgi:hypothetical protein
VAIASQSTLPELPALKNLSAASPVIAVDSREQDALKFTHLKSVVVTLTTADYSLVGGEWAGP